MKWTPPLSMPCWRVVAWFCAAGIACGEESAVRTDAGVLYLANGGFIAGRIAGSSPPSADSLAWQGTEFTSPFQFPLSVVQAVVFPQATTPQSSSGMFCFELLGGDVLYGTLKGVTADRVEIAETTFGDMVIRRENLRRFYRRNRGNSQIYTGPIKLADWLQGPEQNPWREEAGIFLTDQPGAWLQKDFQLPAQAELEIELAWKKPPNFLLALGTGDGNETDLKSYRLEVVNSDLVAVRETRREADLAVITPLGPGEGRVRLTAYLDQQRGRMLVYTVTGTQLADLLVEDDAAKVGSSLTLRNIRGDLSLQRLRISHWNGVAPTSKAGDESRFQPSEGRLQSGRLMKFDTDRQELTFQIGDTESAVPLAQIDDVQLEAMTNVDPRGVSGNVQLSYQDGTCLTGTWLSADGAEIALLPTGTLSAVCAPFKGLRAASFLQTKPARDDALDGSGRLELTESRLRGQLVDGSEQPGASSLTWLPEGSAKASPLLKHAAGRILYRAVPGAAGANAKTEPANNRRPVAVRVLDVGKIVNPGAAKTQPPKPQSSSGKYLHLCNGDIIPCDVKGIDERGVTFETPLSTATFVGHDLVKAVELIKTKGTPKLVRQKRDRLLTLPRMQKDLPPTQLLCSRSANGNVDFLRGRIIEMTDDTVKLEVRQDIRNIPRSRIAQIIWLQQDELDEELPKDAVNSPATADEATRVQTVRSDGVRLTCFVDSVADGLLIGRNEVLGECRIEARQADQLLIGGEIDRSAAKLAYARWKLHHAAEPKFVQEENGEMQAGTDSPLVGRPAPDFTLTALDGTEFKLSDCRGKVTVLDFWATWCGPCLQAMPQVEQVISEFPPEQVRLAAVNLEESPKQISSTLERHKLNVPVVLDQDGIVARKYAASVIPQTVIIDRQGEVVRVFIGGGPQFADQLREAIQSTLESPPTNADPAADVPSGAATNRETAR